MDSSKYSLPKTNDIATMRICNKCLGTISHSGTAKISYSGICSFCNEEKITTPARYILRVIRGKFTSGVHLC